MMNLHTNLSQAVDMMIDSKLDKQEALLLQKISPTVYLKDRQLFEPRILGGNNKWLNAL